MQAFKLKIDALNSWLHTGKQKIINLEELYWMYPERQEDVKYEKDVRKCTVWMMRSDVGV